MDEYKIGDIVKIKKGFKDYDNEKFDLSNWCGIVTDYYEEEMEEIVELEWTPETLLNKIPKKYLIDSISKGYDWSKYSITTDSVLKTDEEVDEEKLLETQVKIEKQYYWYEHYSEGEQIMKLLGEAATTFEQGCNKWKTEIERVAKFPLPCSVREFQVNYEVEQGDEILVNKIIEIDEDKGLMVEGDWNNRTIEFPLCELDVIRRTSESYKIVSLYSYWLYNLPDE